MNNNETIPVSFYDIEGRIIAEACGNISIAAIPNCEDFIEIHDDVGDIVPDNGITLPFMGIVKRVEKEYRLRGGRYYRLRVSVYILASRASK